MNTFQSTTSVILDNNPTTDKVSFIQNIKVAINDIYSALKNYKLWIFMGFSEIRRRYRRTLIGPFWTTLSLGIFIGCMGFLLSSLWKSDPRSFMPYFCTGYVSWILIQSILHEGCVTFMSSEAYMRQIFLPHSTYACLVSSRNLMVFFHHLLVVAIVLVYARTSINLNLLYIIPGLIVTFFTGIWMSLLLGMLCLRFRDFQQIINSLIQLAMFVTPIMWQPHQLGSKGLIVTQLNPLHHYISIIRMPLLGQAPTLDNWMYTIGFSLICALITIIALSKHHKKIIFWL